MLRLPVLIGAFLLTIVVGTIVLLMPVTVAIETALLIPVLIPILISVLARLVVVLLMIALLIRLRVPLLILRLFAGRMRLGIAVSRLGVLVVLETLVRAFGPRLIGLILAELLLRRRNEAEVMFGVLVVIFRSHRIARCGRVARELNVLFGDVVRGSANLHIRAIRFVNARQWIMALAAAPATTAVTTPHPMLVLTVSHGLPVNDS